MLDEFLRSLNTWCGQRQDLLGLLLMGSYARGTAKPDSDVDLILISMQPLAYVDNCRWAEVFGAIKKAELEDWGLVKTCDFSGWREMRMPIHDSCAQEFSDCCKSARGAALCTKKASKSCFCERRYCRLPCR